jgi:hypothetical protein
MELQYVITDGLKYLSKDRNSKVTYTTSKDRAEKYPYDKAINVRDNNLNAGERKNFYLEEYVPKQTKSKNKLSIVKTLPPAPTELSLAGQKIEFDWNKMIEQLDNLMDNIYIYKEQQLAAQQHVDWELSDIDHFIQEHAPAAHVRTKVYTKQMEKRREREQIKINIRYANVIIESIDQGNSLTEIKNRLRGAEPKPYKGRTELYNELLELIG